MSSPAADVTQLLIDWRNGDRAALDRLFPLIYGELHRLAEHYMRRERPSHTLQPTALVHEAYIRLVGMEVHLENRIHFLAIAAQVMRRILVDHARSRQYAKRGGGMPLIPLDEALAVPEQRSADLIALDEALISLAAIDPRKSQVIELRVFGGLTIEETATVLNVSTGTIINDYRLARAWLYNEIEGSEE